MQRGQRLLCPRVLVVVTPWQSLVCAESLRLLLSEPPLVETRARYPHSILVGIYKKEHGEGQ